MTLTLRSPAKINLFLRVMGKRADGFHDLASLFQAISLHDTLSFQLAEKDRLTSSDPMLPCDSSNLIAKALQLFRSSTHKQFCVQIHVEKRIPQCAGLGGGSSNAATTLWGLNKLLGSLYTNDQLLHMGASLGSDVPFFFSVGTAYCTGRGEHVVDMEPLLWLDTLNITKPLEGLSTKVIFEALNLSECCSKNPEELLRSFYTAEPIYVNDLEKPAFHLYPALPDLKNKLEQEGDYKVFMTGTGSALVSIGKGTERPIYRTKSSWY